MLFYAVFLVETRDRDDFLSVSLPFTRKDICPFPEAVEVALSDFRITDFPAIFPCARSETAVALAFERDMRPVFSRLFTLRFTIRLFYRYARSSSN